MPELPEAETMARGLRPHVVGQRIVRVAVRHADVLRQPKTRFANRVRGGRIDAVGRRGKNVVLHLDSHTVLAVNLGMTGRLMPFAKVPRGRSRPTHPAVTFHFETGGRLVFNDVRRFGTLEALTVDEWEDRSSRMGPEPLEPSYGADRLREGLLASRAPVRSWLLDQRRIAGVGNIYANEALFLAGVHPRRPARNVTRTEAYALHEHIRSVLREAIDAGGTTIRDYRNVYGQRGEYVRRLQVYGREGEACDRCRSTVERVVFGGRSAFFCPTCQPASP